MKRFLSILIGTVIAIVILITIVVSLLYTPFVQNKVIEKAVEIINNKTDYSLSVDKFRIGFPLNIGIEDALLDTKTGDTIVYVDKLNVDVSLLKLLNFNVSIKRLAIDNVLLDLAEIIPNIKIDGKLNSFEAVGIDVSLKRKYGSVSEVFFSGLDLDMKTGLNQEPEVEKEESSPLDWKFNIDNLRVTDSKYSLRDVSTFFNLCVKLNRGDLSGGNLSLSDNKYKLSSLKIDDSEFLMKLDSTGQGDGFNPMNIDMTDINIRLNSVYNQLSEVSAIFESASFKDKSGLVVNDIKGKYSMDSTFFAIDGLEIITPTSNINGSARLDMSVFTKKKGKLFSDLNFDLSYSDVFVLAGHYLPEIEKYYPKEDFTAKLDIDGEVDDFTISDLSLLLPNHLDIKANGFVKNVYSPKNASADLAIDADIKDVSFIPGIIESYVNIDSLTIPKNVLINGILKANKGDYTTDLNLSYASTKIQVKGDYAAKNENYNIDLSVDSLSVKSYMPSSSIGLITFRGKAAGKGLDIFNKETSSDMSFNLSRFDIGNNILRNIALNIELKENNYNIKSIGTDSILKFDASIYGVLQKNSITVNVDGDASNVDLGALKVMNRDVCVGSNFVFRATSDFKYNNQLSGFFDKIRIIDNKRSNELGKLSLDAFTNKDTIEATIKNGDLQAHIISPVNLDSLSYQINKFSGLLSSQLERFNFDIASLFSVLPKFNIDVLSGNKNILYGYTNTLGITYDSLHISMVNEDDKGMDGYVKARNLVKDSLVIANADLNFIQSDSVVNYNLKANTKGKDKRSTYYVDLNGVLSNDNLSVGIYQKNGLDSVGFDLASNIKINPDGFVLSFDHEKSTILYKNYFINPDNHIFYSLKHDLDANLLIKGEGGAQLSVMSTTPSKSEDAEAVNLIIEKLQLSEISKYIKSAPGFSGLFDASVNLELQKNRMDVKGSSFLKDFVYNNERIGNIDLAFNYDSGKKIGTNAYAELKIDTVEVLSAFIDDHKLDTVYFKAGVKFEATPLNLVNPFIPDAVASLGGNLFGSINMSGSLSKPVLNGELRTENGLVHVGYANANYKLGDESIKIEKNKFKFNNYNIYAYNNNPLTFNGEINAQNLQNINSNLKVRGQNVELLNVNNDTEQMVYGKMFVSVNSTITGPISLLKIRGNMNVLSGTNFTYTLLDSPVMAQNRVNNLITFTSFTDTTQTKILAPAKTYALTGVDMLTNISIAENVKMAINLSSNGDDRVELVGGGNMIFKANPMGNIDINGRYNLKGGFVRYNLPVLPVAKTFDIKSGSYVEWTGDMMNPFVNITAYEKIRSSVAEEGKGSRSVMFDALIMIKNKLDNLDVSFTVSAPEDPYIQSQLASMTPEERSRQAMNLIITQVYSGPGASNARAATNSAINAFIEKEINQFAGSMLKGVDLSFGIDNYDDASNVGGKRTDYTFRFSKQLFNDRFKIVIGGAVSTGNQTSTTQMQSFIDDVTLEYRLDKSNTRFLQLFHHTGYESVLEGEIVETGIGIVLRRKIRKLRELFIFKKRDRNAFIRKQEIESDLKEKRDAEK